MLSIAQKKIKNKIKIVALVLLGIYIMIGTSLYYLQEKLMFFPTILEDNYTYNFKYHEKDNDGDTDYYYT